MKRLPSGWRELRSTPDPVRGLEKRAGNSNKEMIVQLDISPKTDFTQIVSRRFFKGTAEIRRISFIVQGVHFN